MVLTVSMALTVSNGVDGVDGLTPFIGTNGNWWIGDTDTGVKAEGEQGPQGEKGDAGEDGVGIQSVVVDAEGCLVITMTNGTVNNLGKVAGFLNIEQITTTESKTVLITFSNGLVFETMPIEMLPVGGAIVNITINAQGELLITSLFDITENMGKIVSVNITAEGELKVILEDGDEFSFGNINDYISIIPPAVEHEFSEWITIVEAGTCKPGLNARECSICGETEVKIIGEGHNYVSYEAQTPTCTEIGWNEYQQCSVCGDNNYTEIPATGHIHTETIIEPTCTLPGSRVEECEVCGIVFANEIIPPTGHTSDGEKCINCGIKYCTITINYLYSDRTVAFDSVSVNLWEGDTYSVESPELEDFIADIVTVSGTASDDASIDVIYTPIVLQQIVRIENITPIDVAYNTQFSAIGLPDTVTGYTSDNRSISLTVYWNSSSYSSTTYGTQSVTGIAVAGYGYAISCSNTVSIDVTVVTNVITSINSMDLGKLPLNTEYAGLGLPATAPVTTSTGAVYYLPVEWNEYDYDSSVIGEHIISGVVSLADGFAFGEGVGNSAYITFELSERMYGTADMVFLIDTTGSMWGEIQNVKNNIVRFAEDLEEEGVSVRWALLEYRDITCDGSNSTKVIYCGASEWYIDVISYKQAIANLHVSGGGDREETVVDALKAATFLDSRDAATTFYVVVTDADYKTNNNYGVESMDEMISELEEAGTITSVVTKTSFYSVYRDLADRTNGILANIDANFATELFIRLRELISEEVVYGEVTSIEIANLPSKTEYNSGDYFDGTGMKVIAHYLSGLSREVTGYSVAPYGTLQITDSVVEINYRGKTATVEITVIPTVISVESVVASADNITLTVEETVAVSATVYPTDAINTSVIWTTANPNIAVVSAEGVIEAVGAGETVITVITLDGGFTDEIIVTVLPKPVPVEGIYVDISAVELLVGSSVEVNATVLPEDATDKTLIWTTSNSSVAIVENGTISAVGSGTATITVTTNDGAHKAMIFVSASENSSYITGRVYHSSNNSLLAGVTVNIYNGGTLISTTTTDANGNYSFEDLAYGVYIIEYQKEDFISSQRTFDANAATVQIDDTYLAPDISILPGYASGYVKDATTVDGIQGITVYIREGLGNVTGSYLYDVTTDSTGYYITPELNPGNYTLQFIDNRGGSGVYTTGSINVVIIGDTTSENNDISLSIPMEADTMRIVLEWGETPRDLDSHLMIGDSYHVYYGNKNPNGAQANLDVDDISSYGPETVTITRIKPNTVYKYYVYNYTHGSSSQLSNSGAKVTIFIADRVYKFSVPTGSGYYWDVFTYDSATGEFTFTNSIR